jgi:DNA mismatch repair protein MutS
MPKKFEQIKNYRITISEKDGEIEFLRKIVEGSASKSYGIHVAKKAGLPSAVVSNAQNLMVAMQKEFQKDLAGKRKNNQSSEIPQLSLPFDN